jgi:hypothetical protein
MALSVHCKGCQIPTGICLSPDGLKINILPGSDHVIFCKDGIYHLNPQCHPNLKSYNSNIRKCIETLPSLSITEHSKDNKKKDSIDIMCSICFESENVCLMPCLHTICCDCYVKHEQSDNKCPVCRQEDYGVDGLEPAKKKAKTIRLTSQQPESLLYKPKLMRTPSGPASLRQLSQGSQVEINSDDDEELNPYQRLLEEGKGVFKMRDLEGKMHKKIKALTPIKIDSTLDIASLDISEGFNVTDKLLVDVTTQKKGDSYNDLVVYIVKGDNIEVINYDNKDSSNFSFNHSGDHEEEIDFGVGRFNCLKHCSLFKLEEYKQVKVFFLNEVIPNLDPAKIVSDHSENQYMEQAFAEKYNQFIGKFGDDKPDFVMMFAQVTWIADKTLVSMSPDISPCVSTIFNGEVYTAPWSDSTNMTIHCCIIGKN